MCMVVSDHAIRRVPIEWWDSTELVKCLHVRRTIRGRLNCSDGGLAYRFTEGGDATFTLERED